jgi:hypothetical protein
VRYTTEKIDGVAERVATWYEHVDANDPDATWSNTDERWYKIWRLRRRQLLAYELLKDAGNKQLLSFLSGEGGMGESLLIRLLVQWWRSQGKRVLVCASTAKAARLIGGHTVHHAFKLGNKGGFVSSRLDAEKHSPHWAWLYSRDIIVIDEISMLSASALHGVNHALSHVMSLAASATSRDHFGLKSVLAVGGEKRRAPKKMNRTPRPLQCEPRRRSVLAAHRPVPATSGREVQVPRPDLHVHAMARVPLPLPGRVVPPGRDRAPLRRAALAPSPRRRRAHS